MFGHGLTDLRLRHTRRLSLTALEERCVPAVTTIFTGGKLAVLGDNANQNITITQVGAGSYRVDGLTVGSWTFNGGVNYISVDTKGGTDQVNLVGGGQMALRDGVTVAGKGTLTVVNDRFDINVQSGGFTVSAPSAASMSVTVQAGTKVGKAFNVTGGKGNDSVVLGSGAYVAGRTLLQLGGGTNTTILTGATVDGTLTVSGQSGNDTVELTGAKLGYFFEGFLQLSLNGGSDTVKLTDVTVTGNGAITSTNGVMTIDVINTSFRGYVDAGCREIDALFQNATVAGDRLRVTTGTGNDRIQVRGGRVGGAFSAVMDTGFNRVSVENTPIGKNATVASKGTLEFTAIGPTIQGGLVVDTIAAPSSASATVRLEQTTVKGALSIATGAGNDTVTLRGATIGQANTSAGTTITTGGGNDTVDLGSSTFDSAFARFDGGTGSDTLRKSGAQFRRVPPVVVNFESFG